MNNFKYDNFIEIINYILENDSTMSLEEEFNSFDSYYNEYIKYTETRKISSDIIDKLKQTKLSILIEDFTNDNKQTDFVLYRHIKNKWFLHNLTEEEIKMYFNGLKTDKINDYINYINQIKQYGYNINIELFKKLNEEDKMKILQNESYINLPNYELKDFILLLNEEDKVKILQDENFVKLLGYYLIDVILSLNEENKINVLQNKSIIDLLNFNLKDVILSLNEENKMKILQNKSVVDLSSA